MPLLNIAIIGYGKMGREIEKTALEKGHSVKAIIDPCIKKEGIRFSEINKESLAGVDVCIDFTQPATAVENIKKAAGLKKPIVVGTTGWHDRLEEARKAVEENNTALLYSPNFSIGVNIFFKIVEDAARQINNFDSYDTFIVEFHHSQKLDSPSGTARRLGEIIIGSTDKKTTAMYDRPERKIRPEDLHVTSVRAGTISGTHTVGFDSSADTIELKHTAKSRVGFAQGAVAAAEWIAEKKGIFTLDDMVKNITGGN